MSGRPSGYWVNVRKYFAQGRIYSITLYVDQTYEVRYRTGGYVQVMVKSLMSRNYNVTYLNKIGSRTEGSDTIDTYKCYNGNIEVDFLTYY